MDDVIRWLKNRRDDYRRRLHEMPSLDIRAAEISAIIDALTKGEHLDVSRYVDPFDLLLDENFKVQRQTCSGGNIICDSCGGWGAPAGCRVCGLKYMGS
jgi:hypothetical protein